MISKFKRIVVYDLETGGLDSKKHPITEIALVAIDLESLEIVDEYSSLILPYYDSELYTKDALEFSGISMNLLQDEGKLVSSVVEEVIQFFEKHTIDNSKPILAGHNIKKFDNAFLFKLMKEERKDFEKLINQEEMVDTLRWAWLKWPELATFSLGSCCNAVDLLLKEAHRALPDTKMNARLLIELLMNMRGAGGSGGSYQRRKFDFQF